MFDRISPRYDFLNHLLSLNLDRRWRRHAAREVAAPEHGVVLDLCGGTGDLTLELARSGAAGRVVCCDFSHSMLSRAEPKFRGREAGGCCLVLEADGLQLPLADRTIDAVTVGFGVRNFADLDGGLREIHRVLKPRGRLVVLEFSTPTAPVLAGLYRTYLRRVLPRLGDTISGREGPYRYLARTIDAFPDGPALAERIRDAGFATCRWKGLSGGIVAIHTADKGQQGTPPG